MPKYHFIYRNDYREGETLTQTDTPSEESIELDLPESNKYQVYYLQLADTPELKHLQNFKSMPSATEFCLSQFYHHNDGEVPFIFNGNYTCAYHPEGNRYSYIPNHPKYKLSIDENFPNFLLIVSPTNIITLPFTPGNVWYCIDATEIPLLKTSGFQFKVYSKTTPERGRGVFAKEFIPAGSLVWTLTPNNHESFTYTELLKYLESNSEAKKKFILNHIYCQNNKAVLATDTAEYVNHSSNPNLGESKEDSKLGCWATRDIQPDEELLDDYSKYETPEWYLTLCDKYGVESSRYVAAHYR
jgi:hypothetical protein